MDSISSVTFQYVSGTVDAGSCKRDLLPRKIRSSKSE